MAIIEDLAELEQKLSSLIIKYDQYFIGLEKREPVKLQDEVEKLVRRYANTSINNTMHKHKYNMLTARFNTYREQWNRIVRQIEEGRYSRDRFISNLRHQQQTPAAADRGAKARRADQDQEMDRIFKEFVEARKACNMPVAKLTREQVASTIEKSRSALTAKLGSDNLAFRVVVEEGKPKIKAAIKK
ncbi:MAG TPA: MXAN_5187 C-terminal domain-containing protein [Deltaproteobacteria bacterium]|nr:MXAN_5187 C-terminal domain-containing protein [Deltaproteobacteria bacterium]HQB39278.1 MXAN_5187 C-terminal domain-containing protein [Deltaproteobacteria bacterium]